MWYIFLIFLLRFTFIHCVHPLDKRLRDWQRLKHTDLHLQRHKRSLDVDDNYVVPVDKQVTFSAFQKTFSLSLVTSPEILAPEFKASVHGRYGSSSLEVDKTTLMTGTVMGDPNSHVVAHYDGKTLTASIETKDETYVVEPMWRHLPRNPRVIQNITEHDPSDMVVYRQSDVNLMDQNPHGKNGFCHTKELMDEVRRKQANNLNYKNSFSKHHRSKRSSSDSMKKICKLSLVADYRFFREMGNNSTLETMYYLISLVERVNTIYKNTDWEAESGTGKYKGFGFQINRIRIFNESSKSPRFNQDRYWGARDLLEAFSEKNYSVCLSHLFTYIDFPDGLLGLAFVGSQKRNDVGGICTKSYDPSKNGKLPLYYNTGLTSTVNWGAPILTTEADLVTAHELGHNFGADHDDDTKSSETACTPGQAHGGNYIMFPAAVSGQYPNNKKFSDCSKHAIYLTLSNKADLCFEEDSKAFCGNYRVEPENNETCDVGLFSENDSCCFPNCTLKEKAKCSNKNSPCCTDSCQIADTSKLCRAHIPNLCNDDTYCNGVSSSCPPEKPITDGVQCGDKGKCKNGTCQHFCTTKGLQPCLCLDKENQCNFCCAAPNSSAASNSSAAPNSSAEAGSFECTPYLEDGKPMKLKENAPCTLGYCNQGVCQKHTQDVIERVWDIFQYIAPDKIGEFLADNIVGTVLVFSLLFWIPCSCLINFVDKKRLKERQKEEKWYNDKAGDFTRSFAFRGIGPGSTPVTPRIRISRNNTNWISGGVALGSGFGARDQWRASQEKALALKSSRENFSEQLSAVPGSPNDDNGLSQSQPSLANEAASTNNNRFGRSFPVSLSRSYPSLGSHLSASSSNKSFDGEIKPIAVSSNANIPGMDDSECVVMPQDNAAQYRRSFKRQEAVTTPSY